MRIEKKSGSEERRIVMAMVTDDMVCGKIASKWERQLFRSKWAGLVAGWCTKYFLQYGKAPKANIEGLFERWADKHGEEKETVELVEKFLVSINGEYEQMQEAINSDYILDVARDHFNKVKLDRLADTIKGCLDTADMDTALESVMGYGKVEIGQGAGCDVLSDGKAFKEAFAEAKETLVPYDGALGTFFEDAFKRDCFLSILAPEKRGKTFWLIDIAWRAMLAKRKVAFFACGDMSQRQMLKRLASRAARYPVKAGVQMIPKYIVRDRTSFDHPEIDYIKRRYKKPLSLARVASTMRKLRRETLQTGESLFKLSTHPNSSLSVRGIDLILQQWERDGWTADVVVIDYADILDMSGGGKETRHQIDETWKAMRALSQKRHLCVVTATQSDAASYEAGLLTPSNFSEDKRKLAHVTGMFGLNQTPEEKKQGVYRLNWIVLRESEFDVSHVVYAAGNLGIANPSMMSCF